MKVGKRILGAYLGEPCVGYGVVSETTGNLMQLAVQQAQRRKHIGSLILAALQRRVLTGEPLRVNNIDVELKNALAFYEANGFTTRIYQLELSKRL